MQGWTLWLKLEWLLPERFESSHFHVLSIICLRRLCTSFELFWCFFDKWVVVFKSFSFKVLLFYKLLLLSLLLCFVHVVVNTVLNCLCEFSNLANFLVENSLIIWFYCYPYFIPALADPALSSVSPILTLFDVIISKHSREYNFIHVSSHWIFYKQLIRCLIYSHKHQSKFSSRSLFLLFKRLLLHLNSLSLHT